MNARSTIAVLTALAATGCWPIIPGKADDYIIPETAQVTGSFSLIAPQGGYWDGTPTPSGLGYWGVFDAPRATTGLEPFGVPGTCTRNPTTANDMAAALRSGGSGTTRFLNEDFEFRLTWDEANKAFLGPVEEADFVPETSYALAPVEFGDLGTFEIPEFIETPPTDFVLTSPVITGDTPGTITGPDALTFTWDGHTSDHVAITVFAYDSSNTPLEEVTCLVDDTGSFTVPANLFQSAPVTAFVYVLVGTVSVRGGTTEIAGAEQGYVTSSAYSVQGALAYE